MFAHHLAHAVSALAARNLQGKGNLGTFVGPLCNYNITLGNVYGAVTMPKVIARVHPVHLMNVD